MEVYITRNYIYLRVICPAYMTRLLIFGSSKSKPIRGTDSWSSRGLSGFGEEQNLDAVVVLMKIRISLYLTIKNVKLFVGEAG